MSQGQPQHATAPAGPLARLHERLKGLDDSADRAALARIHSRGLMFLGFLESLKLSVSPGHCGEINELIELLEEK